MVVLWGGWALTPPPPATSYSQNKEKGLSEWGEEELWQD